MLPTKFGIASKLPGLAPRSPTGQAVRMAEQPRRRSIQARAEESQESLGDTAKELAQEAKDAFGAAAERVRQYAAGVADSAQEDIMGSAKEGVGPAGQAALEASEGEMDPAKMTVEEAKGLGRIAWASSKRLASEITGGTYQEEPEPASAVDDLAESAKGGVGMSSPSGLGEGVGRAARQPIGTSSWEEEGSEA